MKPETAASIAESLAARLVGDGARLITRLDAVEHGDNETLTFIRDPRYARAWLESPVPVALIAEADAADIEASLPDGKALIVVADADLAMLELLERATPPISGPAPGVHAHAVVADDADVDPTAAVGAGVVIGPGARIGAGVVLHPGAIVGAEVAISDGAELRPGVIVMDRCRIGRGTLLHPGVVIGADGFGYRPDPNGPGIRKIPHAGNVIIGDGVEIGANTTIDRGKFGPTVVGDGTKIDNLCQIGHNVRIGRCCIICGATALAGSVVIEDGVTLGGRVAVADNLRIGRGARIGAGSGVMDDVPAGATWLGHPACPHREALRRMASISELPKLLRGLKRIARKEEGRGHGDD